MSSVSRAAFSRAAAPHTINGPTRPQSAHNGLVGAWAAAIVALTITGMLAATVQLSLDPRAINDAIAIGQLRSEPDRTRFHAPYRLLVNRAPVDYIDVITPFRKIALAAEARAQIGDRAFGQRQAFEMLAAAPADLELHVELTFHPLNTFVGVPDYALSIVETGGAPVRPRSVDRIPRHEPRVGGLPLLLPNPGGVPARGGQPVLGGTIIGRFDLRPLKPAGVYDVVIEEGGKDLARARVDFSRLR